METITAQLNIKTDKAEKKLEELREKIAQWERELNKVRESEQGLEKSADDAYKKYKASLDVLKEMENVNNSLKSRGRKSEYSTSDLKNQREEVSKYKKEWQEAEKAASKNNSTMFSLEDKIANAREEAEKYVKQINASNSASAKVKKKMEEVGKTVQSISKRIGRLVKSVLVFSVISKGLQMIRDYVENIVEVSPQASEAIAKLKGALLTMVQPIMEYIIPAFTKLINIITKVIYSIAGFFASITGTTVEQLQANAKALYDETDALNATGNAAKKASKQLAAFDEINTLSDSSNDSSSSTSITPIFDFGDVENSKLFTMLSELGKMIREDTAPSIELLKESFNDLIDAWNNLKENPVFQKIVNFLDSCAKALVNGVIDGVAIGLTAIGDAIQVIDDALSGNWLDAITGILQTDLKLIEMLQAPFNKLKETIQSLNIPDWLKKVIGVGGNVAYPSALNYLKQFYNILLQIVNLLNGNKTLKQAWSSIKSGFTTSTNFSVPALANGTVVPRNREFLAMLGDNKKETEVVSPLSTMKQAFLEAMQEGNFGGGDVKVYVGGEQVSSIISRQQRNTSRALGR